MSSTAVKYSSKVNPSAIPDEVTEWGVDEEQSHDVQKRVRFER